METINKPDAESLMNEQLEKIRNFTEETIGSTVQPKVLMAYMMANVCHLAELMWAAKVDLNKGVGLATELFKSMYQQCEELEKEGSNEEAK